MGLFSPIYFVLTHLYRIFASVFSQKSIRLGGVTWEDGTLVCKGADIIFIKGVYHALCLASQNFATSKCRQGQCNDRCP